MPLDAAQLSQLLHALDDPNGLGSPAGYDHRRAHGGSEQLVRRLNADFECEYHVDRDVHLDHHRRIKNDRLAAAGFVWAFVAINNSPGARAHYDRRRRQEHADRHAAALRKLFNRYLGCLHHCLTIRQPYDENKAFPPKVETDPQSSGL